LDIGDWSWITIKKATVDISKKNLSPVHLLNKSDKWDYLQCPIIGFFLTLGKFLEALVSGSGTSLVIFLSFSVLNNVTGFICINFQNTPTIHSNSATSKWL
jgi:hypothetical protein